MARKVNDALALVLLQGEGLLEVKTLSLTAPLEEFSYDALPATIYRSKTCPHAVDPAVQVLVSKQDIHPVEYGWFQLRHSEADAITMLEKRSWVNKTHFTTRLVLEAIDVVDVNQGLIHWYVFYSQVFKWERGKHPGQVLNILQTRRSSSS